MGAAVGDPVGGVGGGVGGAVGDGRISAGAEPQELPNKQCLALKA